MNDKKLKSECCGAEYLFANDENKQGYFQCQKCLKPCNPAPEPQTLRQQISQILVKWGMPSRQVAITEMTELFNLKLIEEKVRWTFPPSFFERMKNIDQPKKEGWRERFDEKFTPHNSQITSFGWSKQDMNGAEQIKDFISQELTSQQQEFIKLVEGKIKEYKREDIRQIERGTPNPYWDIRIKALDDILSAIKKGRKEEIKDKE
jgi:hypothetical protein